MAQLFDNICRTLATPMPRSRALKLILGGLAGAVLAPFGFGQQGCPPERVCTGTANGCCPENQHCCIGGGRSGSNHCCPTPQTCCGIGSGLCCKETTCNPSTGVCCGGPSATAPCR